MSDPLTKTLESVNQINSSVLKSINDGIANKIKQNAERAKLEERTVNNVARLRVQEANYSSTAQSRAVRDEVAVVTANANIDKDNRQITVDGTNDLIALNKDELATLQAARLAVTLEGGDTTDIDNQINTNAKNYNLLKSIMFQAVVGQRGNAANQGAAPQSANMGMPGYGGEAPAYNESTFTREGNEDRLIIEGLTVTPEEREMMIRVTAAEVGTQTDQDGATMMAETIRNRHLFTKKPISSLITPAYYETMREGSDTYSKVDPESEAYANAEIAVDRALAGSNLANSATNNYYGPAWNTDAQKNNDSYEYKEYQGEIFYKKNSEKDFDFNKYVVIDPVNAELFPGQYSSGGIELPSKDLSLIHI